ncbi:MAG: glycerol-3-phosphate dehydrogenase [Bacteroidetes bacterium HGW-Bacteroidetes-1]|jgi:glycerol-3-phosphate dehydrogenase (NAD(P)+)|nr:MAG: glycerol-3-phosphate dehydrogenase [Bacteroidetes bacterium HGW-Bacteroidetes-1]
MKKEKNKNNIVFIGSGAIATSLGNILASNDDNVVCLLSIEKDVIESINIHHVNSGYFPNIQLHSRLLASDDKELLSVADLIFLAIPSVSVVNYLKNNQQFISKDTLLVNLAKGFGTENELIHEAVSSFMPNNLAVMKGPSFAREIINMQPTAFTIASNDPDCFNLFIHIFEDTSIYLDFTNDIIGVEYASILKNIYAIIIGIVDANFDSPNLRSLVLSKSINEMRSLIKRFGGSNETIFNYCGFGDFSLTALNDLSRNRTLGLLIGKGFFTQGISDKVVLEGRIAVNVFHQLLKNSIGSETEYPLLVELYKVFNETYDIKKFVGNILVT